MSFQQLQLQTAVQSQLQAARDMNQRVRLIAGPGTGKSRSIVDRVDYLLSQGTLPTELFVISFTRASAADLQRRIVDHCTQTGRGVLAQGISVSTMYSLALRTLKSANLLQGFPTANPMILDDWEQTEIFDTELETTLTGSGMARAKEIRRAYDAYWQTLHEVDPKIRTGG